MPSDQPQPASRGAHGYAQRLLRLAEEAEGFPAVDGLELALYARSDLGAVGRALRDEPTDLCAWRAGAALRARRR